jgi:hypothetical protein
MPHFPSFLATGSGKEKQERVHEDIRVWLIVLSSGLLVREFFFSTLVSVGTGVGFLSFAETSTSVGFGFGLSIANICRYVAHFNSGSTCNGCIPIN